MNDWHKFTAWALLACTASLTFAGCGGGSGDDGQPPSSARFAAEGFWGGPVVVDGNLVQPFSGIQANFWDTTATDGSHAGLVVLPTGETWMRYITGGVINGPGHGQTEITGTSLRTSITSFGTASVSSDNYLGSVVSQSKLNIIVSPATPGNSSVSLQTIYDSRYDQTASLPQLAGTYTGIGGSGTYYRVTTPTTTSNTATATDSSANAPAGGPPPTPSALSVLGDNYTITISSTGAVTLPPDPEGCSGSGTATPRTDSNILTLSLQFSGAKCVLGNGAKVSGIAVVENRHLLMMAVPPGTTPAGEFVFVSN